MRFGPMLQRARAAAQVSLRDLARAVELSPIYISDIEREHRRPPASPVIVRMAERLGVDAEPLLKAALEQRDAIELAMPAGGTTEKKKEAALTLARAWDDIDDETLAELTRLLERQRPEG